MDLKKLFSVQKVLRDRINYNESDRFDKLVLALLVEVGECANEWRGFKFWSKDQGPRISKYELCEGPGEHGPQLTHKNPLLEEYVDGLHFILEIGIQLGCDYDLSRYTNNGNTTLAAFKEVFYYVTELDVGKAEHHQGYYDDLFESYLELGESLGFTFEEIEEAYFKKNEINHKRQDSGTY